MRTLRRRLALGLGFGFAILLGLALFADLQQVSTQFVRFPWELFPLILLCTLFNYTLRFAKWHFYLTLIGAGHLSLVESLRIFIAGFPLAVTPGKAGEALKGLWLNRAAGAPVAKGITVVLAERISDGIAVLALSTFGVIAYPRYWPAFATVLGILLGIILLSQWRPVVLRMLSLTDRFSLSRRLSRPLRDFYDGAYALFRPVPTVAAVGLGAIAWLGEGVGMYLVLLGLGVPASWSTFGLAVFVLSFSTVVGAVSALPGGLLAAEGSITGMLALLLALPASIAVTATLIIRFGTLWFGVALGLVVWGFSPELLSGEEHPRPSEMNG